MNNGSGVTSNTCGGVPAVPEEYMDYSDSEQWNLLEICYCSACTEALSMLSWGGSSPTLVSRGLQERPVKNSTQKIQDTLTSWGRNI